MRVTDLSGAELDYWVAKADGREARINHGETEILLPQSEHRGIGNQWFLFDPSVRWDKAGPIIEREKIALNIHADGTEWYAWFPMSKTLPRGYNGPTPLVAAMRAYVASKFGDEVTG